MAVTMADIQKLRNVTGAGMMDCKSALNEAGGDIEAAKQILRKKGQAVAAKREDREAAEGCVLAATSGDFAAIVALKCETDFVAKNEEFIALTQQILDAAIAHKPETIEALLALKLNAGTIAELITDRSGVTGEKMELGYYEHLTSPCVAKYIHPGNRLATIVAFNKEAGENVQKDVAMQVAAMNPVAVSKEGVSQEIIDTEFKIAREKAQEAGKPENLLDKIAEGALTKFFKENTLLQQEYIKDNKLTIEQFLKQNDKDLTVTAFKRVSLSV
jgi:elongation factor Ts